MYCMTYSSHLLTSRCTIWHHDIFSIILISWCTFWHWDTLHTSWRSFWHHAIFNILFDVRTFLLIAWSTFWHCSMLSIISVYITWRHDFFTIISRSAVPSGSGAFQIPTRPSSSSSASTLRRGRANLRKASCSNLFSFLTWSFFGMTLTKYHKKDLVESL